MGDDDMQPASQPAIDPAGRTALRGAPAFTQNDAFVPFLVSDGAVRRRVLACKPEAVGLITFFFGAEQSRACVICVKLGRDQHLCAPARQRLDTDGVRKAGGHAD